MGIRLRGDGQSRRRYLVINFICHQRKLQTVRIFVKHDTALVFELVAGFFDEFLNLNGAAGIELFHVIKIFFGFLAVVISIDRKKRDLWISLEERGVFIIWIHDYVRFLVVLL